MANIYLPPVIPAFNGVLCMATIGPCTSGSLPAPEWVSVGGMENVEIEAPVNMVDSPMYGTRGWMTRTPAFAAWSATVGGVYLERRDEGQELIMDNFFGGNIALVDTMPTVECGEPVSLGCLPDSITCTQRDPMWFRFIPDGCGSPLTGTTHMQYIGIGYISTWGIVSQVEDKLVINLEVTGTGALVPGLVTVGGE